MAPAGAALDRAGHRRENLKSYIGTISFLRIVLRLLVTANIVPSSLILFTLMMEAICFSEMSVLTRTTRRHIQEDGILQLAHSLHSDNEGNTLLRNVRSYESHTA
jgi:hypothetical protein